MDYKIKIGEREMIFNVSNLAEQASGSSFLKYGDTVVLSTVCVSSYEKEQIEFFPLTVEYEEKYYAAGKIKGPRFIKRETRPSDEAICNARMVDRAIRPLFPKELNREVQVINTVLSWDGENDPDILALLATSFSILISEIPWKGPVGAVRVAKIGEKFIINPTYKEKEESEMDVVFSGVKRNGEILVNMIEGDFLEVDEKTILRAFDFAKTEIEKLINFQEKIAKEIAKKKIPLKIEEKDVFFEEELRKFLKGKLKEALFQKEKNEKLSQLKKEFLEFVNQNFPEKTFSALRFLEKEIENTLAKEIIENGNRPDGRKIDEMRKISCQVSVLPRTHGSAVFCRGQTKSLSILTLGAPGDVQLLEGMEISGKKRFMHHYNFPPYSVGEIAPLKGPGRREIGHGMLVERALLPIIPDFEQFPYTIRIVSEILSSNGSTSMASACSSSLALMDAGVPIKRPVAGIALGLVTNEKGDYRILTDIQGPEDHYGDMDFKVAGTEKGVTAIQMDLKIDGISKKIFQEALERGKEARLKILKIMKEILPAPRETLSPFAPKILTIQINPEKIRDVIGPGGRMINEIISETGVSIDIEESGKIFVTAENEEAAKKAISWIKNITREVKVGEVFQGKVKRILSFGALIEILPGQDGLLHISRLKKYKGLKLKVGDIIPVKVISIDNLGRINLALIKKYYGGGN
jgi:polyribonucleotide nucleotidyltransferase